MPSTTFADIAERRNRLDPYSDDEERFRNAVKEAYERGLTPWEIKKMCRHRPPVGRILTIVKEMDGDEL